MARRRTEVLVAMAVRVVDAVADVVEAAAIAKAVASKETWVTKATRAGISPAPVKLPTRNASSMPR